MVPESEQRTSTVPCTFDVPHPANSDMRCGGKSRRPELLTLPCAAHPRVAPKEARAASRVLEQWVDQEGSNKHLPVVNEPFITDAFGLEKIGDELAHMRVARLSQDHRTLDGAQHITLLSSTQLVAKVAPEGREMTDSD